MKHIAFFFTPNSIQAVHVYIDVGLTLQCVSRTQLIMMDNIRAIWGDDISICNSYSGWPCELERVE